MEISIIETIFGVVAILTVPIGGLISMSVKQSKIETTVKSQSTQIDKIVLDLETEETKRENDRNGLYRKLEDVKDKIDADMIEIGKGLTRVETKIDTLLNGKK